MKEKGISLIAIAGIVLLIASAGLANVPAPPVNQIAGFPDTEFNFLTEADCRVCHELTSNTADRHHMLYGDPMIGPGECSENIGTCSVTTAQACVADADCPTGETCEDQPEDACYINSECETALDVCSRGEPCGTCSVTTAQACGQDVDCPTGETCVDGCPSYHGVPGQCGQPICVGGSMAPNDPNAGVYGCLTCHEQAVVGGVITFLVERDCMVCHEYRGGATVHHLDSKVEGAKAGICNTCHGDLVDNIVGCDPLVAGNCSDTNLTCGVDSDCKSGACSTSSDPCYDDTDCLDGTCDVSGDPCRVFGDCDDPLDTACVGGGVETCVGGGTTTCDLATCDHVIPTYTPSLVTPKPAGGEAGDCDSCHAPGDDTASGVHVHNNHDTHHHAGINYFADGSRFDACFWCHQDGRPGNGPEETEIRTCENCHGYESLHNIQVDSDTDCVYDPSDPGACTIVVGGEAAGYGHVGIDDPTGDSDCWGCHGFSTLSAPAAGPIVPSLGDASVTTITAGEATAITLTGSAFTNDAFTSVVEITAPDGTVADVTPDSISVGSLTAIIPALDAGRYDIRVKKVDVVSNPIAISCVPAVAIDSVVCADGTLTVTGSGFGDTPPEGTEAYLNVQVNGVPVVVISWTDTVIVADVFTCSGTVTVNSLFGSAIAEGSDCEVCAADCNNDGTVDLFDLIVLINEFLRADCDTNPCQADCDGNGQVDIFDLVVMKLQFLKGNCCLQ